MIRPMLPVLGAVVLCACSFSTLAADNAATSTSNSSAQLRQQIEHKRDQLSGVSTVAKPSQSGPATVLEAPVDTGDAPAQVTQP